MATPEVTSAAQLAEALREATVERARALGPVVGDDRSRFAWFAAVMPDGGRYRVTIEEMGN
jgi:hypothetical protein